MRARDGVREETRGLVLAHVARVQPRDDDLGHTRGFERVDARRVERFTLLEDKSVASDRMGDNAAQRVPDRNRAEFHAAFSARKGFLRRAAMISPSTETAISAGDTEPMSRPMGA